MSSDRPHIESRTERPIRHDTVESVDVVDAGHGVVANDPLFRDRVRWGPILAGVLTALTTLIVMTVLGLAIGMTAFDPGDDSIGTAAAAWGILSALLAFFLGGWVAGRNALASADDNGALNGFLVGAATIVVMLWMIGAGVGNLLGITGANIDEIVNISPTESVATQADDAAESVASAAQANYDEARNSAWGTLAGLVLALVAAAAGGALGHPDRAMVNTDVRRRRTATQPR